MAAGARRQSLQLRAPAFSSRLRGRFPQSSIGPDERCSLPVVVVEFTFCCQPSNRCKLSSLAHFNGSKQANDVEGRFGARKEFLSSSFREPVVVLLLCNRLNRPLRRAARRQVARVSDARLNVREAKSFSETFSSNEQNQSQIMEPSVLRYCTVVAATTKANDRRHREWVFVVAAVLVSLSPSPWLWLCGRHFLLRVGNFLLLARDSTELSRHN